MTLRIILKNIIKGVILNFIVVSLFVVFSNPVHGIEVTGKKAEFYFPIFMELIFRRAHSDLILK